MSERSVFPEPATTKGGGGPAPSGSSGAGPAAIAGAPPRFALWLIVSLALAAASVYGLFLDRSIRPDPFARSISLGDWLLHTQPHPALTRIPVVPIGANGTLTFRPAETGWINTPYLPGTEVASANNESSAAAAFNVSLITSAYAADAPQPKAPTKVAPPNAPVLNPELLKKSEGAPVTKEPTTYGEPAQQTTEQAVAPPAVNPPPNQAAQTARLPAQETEPAPEPTVVDEPTGPPRILHAQFLADGRRGWVAGEAPGIMATDDGGRSWKTLGSTLSGPIPVFEFESDGKSGYLHSSAGWFDTVTGGKEWTARPAAGALAKGRWDWAHVGTGAKQVAPIPAGSFVPLADAGEYLFTTARGRLFSVAAQVGPSDEEAARRAREMGEEPGRFHVTYRTELDAWGAGDGGALVRLAGPTMDPQSARDPWEQRKTPTKANLRSLYFQADGEIGWAASGWDDGNEEADRPVILQTVDGGTTWQRLPYRHLPAPWLFLALPAFILAGYRTTTAWLDLRATPPRRASVADEAASDAPIGWEDRDALGLQAIARALSKFVRNRNTIPPLTFAVSGPWGTGKSSLMNLVAQDLRTFGTRAVWFNAWHHQKEEHLLAALLEAIRSQAIPTWWRWSGLSFRLRLLWRRVRSDVQSALAVVFLGVVVVAAFQLLLDPDDVQEALSALTDTTFGEWLTGALLGKLTALGSFGAGLYAVSLALLKLRVITLNPAQLMASMRDRSRVSDLRDQLGFRHRFDREFNSVCHALRTRRTAGMVIMIDDLDRCQPGNVLDILEAVNYLATAGPCFIFLGIDTEKVTSSVAHGFKDSILVLPDGHGEAEAQRALEPDAVALATFARAYLEKLINITVPIPTATDRTSAALLDVPWQEAAAANQAAEPDVAGGPPTSAGEDEDAPLSPWPARARRWVHDAWDVGTGLAALALAICITAGGVVQLVQERWPGAPARPAAAAVAATANAPAANQPGASTPAPGGPAAESTGEESVSTTATAPTVTAAEVTAHPLLPYAPFILPALALILVGFWVAGRILAVQEAMVEDSVDFREALRIFNKAIFAASPTPRGVKRFENRLRYLAMRSRGDDRPPDWLDHLFARLGHRVRTEDQRHEVDIPEPTLVALGAIAGIDEQILPRATDSEDQGIDSVIYLDLFAYEQDFNKELMPDMSNPRVRERRKHLTEVQSGIESFQQSFDGLWPPTLDQVRAFCDLSGTIRD